MNAIELFNAKGESTGVWCCGVCKTISIKDWSGYIKNGKSNTNEAADLCCLPKICPACDAEIHDTVFRTTGMCSTCDTEYYRTKHQNRYEASMLSATLVPHSEHEGPVTCDGFHSGDMGDEYYSSIDLLVDDIVESEYIRDESGSVVEELIPEFAFCCASETRLISVDYILENLCSDGYEGMEDNLRVPESLHDAIEEFNRINESYLTVWDEDRKRKVEIRSLVLQALRDS